MANSKNSERREKGSGSYRLRNDGRWEGRYKGKVCYGNTEAQIKKTLKNLVYEVDNGIYQDKKAKQTEETPIIQQKQTEETPQGQFEEAELTVVSAPEKQETDVLVGQWLDLWLSEYKVLTLKKSTYASYYNCINLYLKPLLGQIPLSALSPHEIQTTFNDLSKGTESINKLAPATIVKCRNVLNAAYEQAIKNRMLQYNPVRATTPPKGSPPEIGILTVEEQQKFIQTVQGNRLEAFFIAALSTGMRRGELIALTWDCVDFEKKTITVKASANRVQTPEKGGSEFVVDTTKTAAGKRQIPLLDSLIPVLQAQFEQQSLEKKFAGSAWTENNLVFCTGLGTYIEPRNINRELKKILEKADLPSINVHALRHTFASRMLENGVHIKVVQEILGHADASLTLNTYSHIVGTTAHDQINKLNTIFTEVPTNDNPVFRRNMNLSAANQKRKKGIAR